MHQMQAPGTTGDHQQDATTTDRANYLILLGKPSRESIAGRNGQQRQPRPTGTTCRSHRYHGKLARQQGSRQDGLAGTLLTAYSYQILGYVKIVLRLLRLCYGIVNNCAILISQFTFNSIAHWGNSITQCAAAHIKL